MDTVYDKVMEILDALYELWPESRLTQALTAGAIVGVSAYLLLKKRYKLPPGPPAWPLVGNMISMTRGPHYFVTLYDWSKQYGPVMTINMGATRTVVLSRIDVVLEAMVKRQADFAGRMQSFTISKCTDGYKDIMAASYGPTWKLHRKIASKAFRHYMSGNALSKRISESLKEMVRHMGKETGPFEPMPYLSFVVFNIISGMCFNKISTDLNDDWFDVLVGEMDKVSKEAGGLFLEDFLPLLRLWPTAKFRRMFAANRRAQAAIRNNIDEHRRYFSEDNVRDLTDALLLAQKEAAEEEDPELLAQITDVHVIQTISDVLFAGIDTSRVTLNWALLVMALHPDVQEKIQKEVDKVIGPDLNVDVGDRSKMPYTEAVLHETMRMRLVAPLGVPHTTMCDTTVGGYDVPKGTLVLINHHALHHDPDQWDEPTTFRPERYLDASGQMAAKPESWLSFGCGRRVCLGETVAKPELHLLLAGIMRAFSVQLAAGDTTDFEPQNKGVTNTAKNYKIIVTSRL